MTPDLERRLVSQGTAPRARGKPLLRFGVVLLGLIALAVSVSQLNLEHDLQRLDAGFLSGLPEGNYHAISAELVRTAAAAGGRLREVPSEGSTDNIARLRAARVSCEVAFGLAQDGSDWGHAGDLQLIGRLAKAESVFFLGLHADAVTELSQLARAKIGVGLQGSGSAQLVQRLFQMPALAPLAVELQYGTPAQQLEQVERGQLDLMVVVQDEDTPWLVEVLRQGKLQIAGLSRLDVLARKLPHFRTGRIGAGQFDPVAVLPPVDKRVLRVDTLVIANGCASRSATLDLLSLLAQQFPDFVRHNQETANTTELELVPAARDFLEHGGPEFAETYAPWLVDLMPPANWAYFVMGASLLFNAMGLGHRFRLWRIDVARVRLESEIAALFGPTTTLGDIARAQPDEQAFPPPRRARVTQVIKALEVLAERCRRQSLSMLVPMGQEMTYRYQEGLINDALAVLRGFVARREAGGAANA
jgi:TRAP-type uncharacterized transport system substrate-binding protein